MPSSILWQVFLSTPGPSSESKSGTCIAIQFTSPTFSVGNTEFETSPTYFSQSCTLSSIPANKSKAGGTGGRKGKIPLNLIKTAERTVGMNCRLDRNVSFFAAPLHLLPSSFLHLISRHQERISVGRISAYGFPRDLDSYCFGWGETEFFIGVAQPPEKDWDKAILKMWCYWDTVWLRTVVRRLSFQMTYSSLLRIFALPPKF
ncbi:hypothetical protein CEXT_225831 [Caerostris extrusa]|uniref:Uncharacterized protein n=1 Tax=Caerostris extrusa TaxID=172846 RepID=A0AAV4REQ8_CAEEX|nr:hypothetical protein CEXT_225831 [Caerostris extrusa]